MDMIERGRSSFACGSALEQRCLFVRHLLFKFRGEKHRSSSDVASELLIICGHYLIRGEIVIFHALVSAPSVSADSLHVGVRVKAGQGKKGTNTLVHGQ